MRPFAAAALVVMSAGPVVAQEAAAPAQTPETAAKFIDTVLGSGAMRAGQLIRADAYNDIVAVEGARTGDCKTVVYSPARDMGDRWRLEIDWQKFVSAEAFPGAAERPVVRVIAQTTENLADKADIDKLNLGFGSKKIMGVAIETGTLELRDRLVRAMAFYGKSCAPALDGPF